MIIFGLNVGINWLVVGSDSKNSSLMYIGQYIERKCGNFDCLCPLDGIMLESDGTKNEISWGSKSNGKLFQHSLLSLGVLIRILLLNYNIKEMNRSREFSKIKYFGHIMIGLHSRAVPNFEDVLLPLNSVHSLCYQSIHCWLWRINKF